MQEPPGQAAQPPATQAYVPGVGSAELDEPSPFWEQRSALVIGFGTGMLIAAIFLAYVVLSAAQALP